MRAWVSIRAIVMAALWGAVSAGALAQNFNEAQAAYVRGDYALAERIASQLAAQRDARAMVMMAMMYRDGKGRPQNLPAAASWYAEAASLGDAIAQGQLGSLYEDGRGVAADAELAAYWYRRSAEQGNAAATANLGSLYEAGKGLPRSEAFALALYMQAYARAPSNKAIADLHQERLGRATPELRALAQGLAQRLAQAGGYAQVLGATAVPAALAQAQESQAAAAAATAAPAAAMPPTAQVAAAPATPTMNPQERQAALDRTARAAPGVKVNEANPAAQEGRRSLEARMKCEASVKGRVWTAPETQALVERCFESEMQRSEQRDSAVEAASNDPRAIFGLLVGAPLPSRIPKCNENLTSDLPLMPADKPYCLSTLATGLESLVSFFGDMDAGDYRKIDIYFGTLGINEQIYDTRLAQGVTVYIDKDEKLHMLTVRTWASQYNEVLAMLVKKFGRATRQGSSQWVNRQTGQVIGSSPNHGWNVQGLVVEYQSQVAGLLNDRTATGMITIHTPDLARRVQAYIARRDGPDPRKKPM